jgi:hypothetical protein
MIGHNRSDPKVKAFENFFINLNWNQGKKISSPPGQSLDLRLFTVELPP